MEPSEGNIDKMQVDLASVESINNLDTARMALRWALERLHALEKLKEDLAGSAERDSKARAQAEAAGEALRDTLNQREAESRGRELYYQKLEEFVSLRLAGRIDVKALIEKDVELSRMTEFIQQRQVTLEKEHALKREDLEREYQALRAQAQRETRERTQTEEQSLLDRRKALEKEHLGRLGELRERELLFEREERSLNERKNKFSEFYASQRAEMDAASRNFNTELDDRTQFRIQQAQQLLAKRLADKEASWTLERDTLSSALQEWRQKAEELFALTQEFERRTAASEEAAALARKETDFERARREEFQRAGEAEKASLVPSLEMWKAKAQEHIARANDLERKIATVEAELVKARDRISNGEAHLESLQSSWEQESLMLSSELHQWKRKAEEQLERSLESGRRLEAAQAEVKLAQTAAESERARSEARLKEWEQERTGLLAEQARLIQETSSWKTRAEEQLSRAHALGRKLDAAEAEVKLAQNALEAEHAQLESRQKAWSQERDDILKDRDLLSSQLDSWKKMVADQSTRCADLERQLFETQETLAQALGTVEIKDAQRLAQSDLWDSEKAALLQDQEMLSGQVREGKSREELLRSRVLETERRLFEAEESLSGSRTEGERLRAQLESERAAWKAESAEFLRERDLLRADAEEWRAKHQDQLSRTLDLERDLAKAKEEAAQAPQPARVENAQLKARLEGWEKEKAALFPELDQWRKRAEEQLERSLGLEHRLVAAQEELSRAQRPAELRQAQLEGEREAFSRERAALASELEQWKQKSMEQLAHSLEIERKLAAAREETQHAESAVERQKERHASLETRWAQELSALLIELHAGRQKAREQFEVILDLERRLTASEEESRRARNSPAALKNAQFEQRRKALEDEKAGLILELTQWRQMADEHASKTLDLERKLLLAEEELARSRQSAGLEESRLQARTKALEEERSRLAPELEKWRKAAELNAKRLAEVERDLAAAREDARAGLLPLEARNSALDARHKALEAERETLVSEMDYWKAKTGDQSRRLLELEKILTSLQQEAQAQSSLRWEKTGWEAQRKALEQDRSGLAQERDRLDEELRRWRGDAQEHLKRSEELSRKLAASQEAEHSSRDEAAREREKALRAGADWEAEKALLLKERENLASTASEWRKRAAEHCERRTELELALAQAQERARCERLPLEKINVQLEARREAWEQEKALLSKEQERLRAELEAWRLKAQEHVAKAQELSQSLFSAEKGADLAKSAAQLEHAQLETLRGIWEQERSMLSQDQDLLASELLELKGKADGNAAKLRETERRLAQAEEEAASAKSPLEAKTARLEAQRRTWEAEKAVLLQEQARFSAENEAWRIKAQDHLARSRDLAHRLADADKAAELARSAAQIEHAQAERLREIWEQDKRLLLQDHLLLTSDLLELKGRSEKQYAQSRELERFLAAARAELEQVRRPLEAQTQRHKAERAAWEGERESLSRAHDSLRAELERWRAQARSHQERVNELDFALAGAQEELERRDSPLQRRAEDLEAQRGAWESERAALVEEGRRLGSELERWRAQAQEQVARSRELLQRLASAQSAAASARSAAETAEGAVEIERAQAEGLRRQWEQEKAALLPAVERWRAAAADQAKRAAGLEERLAAAEEEKAGLQGLSQVHSARSQAKRAAWERERKDLSAELESWKRRVEDQTSRALEIERKLAAAQEAALHAQSAAQRHQERHAALETQWAQELGRMLQELRGSQEKSREQFRCIMELESRLNESQQAVWLARSAAEMEGPQLEAQRQAWEKERAELLPKLEEWRRKAEERSLHSASLEKRLCEAEAALAGLRGPLQSLSAEQQSRVEFWEKERAALRFELEQWKSKSREGVENSLELENRLAAAEEAALHAQSAAQRHQERHAALETEWAGEISALLKELRESREKARGQQELVLDLETRLAAAEASRPPRPKK